MPRKGAWGGIPWTLLAVLVNAAAWVLAVRVSVETSVSCFELEPPDVTEELAPLTESISRAALPPDVPEELGARLRSASRELAP